MRLLVVMTLKVAKIRHTSGSLHGTVSFQSANQTKGSGLSAARKYVHEKADGTRSVARGVNQNLQQRSCGRADDLVDVTGDEEQDNEEDSAGEGADTDADDHDLGAF